MMGGSPNGASLATVAQLAWPAAADEASPISSTQFSTLAATLIGPDWAQQLGVQSAITAATDWRTQVSASAVSAAIDPAKASALAATVVGADWQSQLGLDDVDAYLSSGAWLSDLQAQPSVDGATLQSLSAARQNVFTYISTVDAGVAPSVDSPAWSTVFAAAASGAPLTADWLTAPASAGADSSDGESSPGNSSPSMALPLVASPRTIIGSQLDDLIFGTSGADDIQGQGGNDEINALDGNDTVHGDDGDDLIIDGAEGANYTHRDDTIDGGAGDDNINGGEGADTINGGEGAGGVIYGGNGNDILSNGAEGGALYGEDGDDTLNGGSGGDVLVGGGGDDTLNGGVGNDTYRFAGSDDLGTDTIVDAAANGGTDTLDFSQLDFGSGVNIDTGLADEQLVAAGDGAALYLNLSGAVGGLESIDGTQSDDTIYAAPGANYLYGGSGDDTYVFAGSAIFGQAGNVSISEAAGAAGGNDTLDFSQLDYSSADSPDAGVMINLSDTSSAPASIAASYGDKLLRVGLGSYASNIENVIGTQFSDTITGNAAANVLSGGAGNDVINGGAGDDTISGDEGNDTLSGGDGQDTLSGGDGDDSLDGGAGDDSLSGDDGVDTMIGGLGQDAFTTDADDPLSAPQVDPINGGQPIVIRKDQPLAVRVMADDLQTPYNLLSFRVDSGAATMNDPYFDGPGVLGSYPGWLAVGTNLLTVTVTDQGAGAQRLNSKSTSPTSTRRLLRATGTPATFSTLLPGQDRLRSF